MPAENLKYPLSKLAVSSLHKLRNDEGKGAFTMTIGEKIQEEAWHAREEGRAEGLEKGRAEGLEKGRAEAREAYEAYIENLMQKLHMTREEAEKILA